MARVLVLTDRHPEDPDWKGAITWNLIRALSESQHQVLVLTTLDPESITISHPRLTIARPATSWDARQLPKFLKGIFLFRPEVIHTFAVKPSRLWKSLTIWPYLHAACQVLPTLKRFSTVFEMSDLPENDPSLPWHRGSQCAVIFSAQHGRALTLTTEISPLEIELPSSSLVPTDHAPYVMVPAPVGEWKNPQRDLLLLSRFLSENPEVHARVAGGWGDWPASSRRVAWSKMMSVADRLHMLGPLTLEQMIEEARGAQTLWCDCVDPESWRGLMAAQLAEGLRIPARGGRPALAPGSTVHFLSRLFTGSLNP